MNKPIRTVSIFCLLLFLALALNATYLQYYHASALNDRLGNGRVAAATFSGFGNLALPLVEKESIATRGLMPVSCRQVVPVCTAIVASCSTVGSGMTAQSAKNITPFSPYRLLERSSIMQLETLVVPGSGLMSWRRGRNDDPAVSRAPVTSAST